MSADNTNTGENPISPAPVLPPHANFLTDVVEAYTTAVPGQDTQCSICLELCVPAQLSILDNDSALRVIACTHLFHVGCMVTWFNSNANAMVRCPNCRGPIIANDPIPGTIPTAPQPLPNAIANPRFTVTFAQPGFAATMAEDLTRLAFFLTYAVGIEEDAAEITARPLNVNLILDDALFNYEEEQFPRTDFITDPHLQRFVAVAALVHVWARLPHRNTTPEYAQLLTMGERMLLEAQQIAVVMDDEEYMRVLAHPDDWEEAQDVEYALLGNQELVRWVVGLRIRTRGRGADPLGELDDFVMW